MKNALPIFALCAAILPACSVAALSAETVTQVALTKAGSGCPAGSVDGAMVAVKLVLPAAAASDVAPRPVNRFRYNFNVDASASRPVITGEIRDFGAPGCTVSFAGLGVSYD